MGNHGYSPEREGLCASCRFAGIVCKSFQSSLCGFCPFILPYSRSLRIEGKLRMNHVAKAVTVKPPERGVFALDHEGECKTQMKEYLKCLSENKADHFPCKMLSRAYLSCRMEKDLMAKGSECQISSILLHETFYLLSLISPRPVTTPTWLP